MDNVDEFDPVAETPKFTFLVDANAPVGIGVGHVTVTDADKGMLGWIDGGAHTYTHTHTQRERKRERERERKRNV